jgi:predicted lipid carrier protein YhbT
MIASNAVASIAHATGSVGDTRVLSRRRPPPLTPVLFAGLLLRRLPAGLMQPPAGMALRAVMRRHPEIAERLAGLEGRSLLLDPTDLPASLLLRFEANGPTLSILGPDRRPPVEANAVVHGPLLTLIDLLEGRIDGDALFFSRRLQVEGEMDVVVALRNALDGAAIDLGEAAAGLFGPLAHPAARLACLARAAVEAMSADLEFLTGAANASLGARLDAHDAAVRRSEQATAAHAKPRRAGPP